MKSNLFVSLKCLSIFVNEDSEISGGRYPFIPWLGVLVTLKLQQLNLQSKVRLDYKSVCSILLEILTGCELYYGLVFLVSARF